MTEELHRKTARQLLEDWRWFNTNYLRDALRPPVVEIGRNTHTLGQWRAEIRTLVISEHHILNDPWPAVLSTLRHEMAHQYVSEVLKAHGEPPHGPAFRLACEKLRVSPAASGTGSDDHGDVHAPRHRITDKIHKLLALGESPNRNEADAALQKARELLLKHNLSEIDVDRGRHRSFDSRQLGHPTRRRHLHELHLATVLVDFFFVEAIWIDVYMAQQGHRAQQLEIWGTQTNCDLAEYVHAYVTSLLAPLWQAHKDKRRIHGNRERLRFFAGVVAGFHKSLAAQTRKLEERALVWKGDPHLQQHFRWHYPALRRQSFGGGSQTAAYHAGVREGEKVRLRRPLREGGRSTFGGLLTDGRA